MINIQRRTVFAVEFEFTVYLFRPAGTERLLRARPGCTPTYGKFRYQPRLGSRYRLVLLIVLPDLVHGFFSKFGRDDQPESSVIAKNIVRNL